MLLWVVMAAMTGAAVLAVLLPLARSRAAGAGGDDVAVYRDQLAEVERDRARGVLAPNEAEAAKAEVGRRLLAAAERGRTAAPAGSDPGRRKAAALAVLLGVPAAALGGYLLLGSPDLPGQPLAARLATPPEQSTGRELIARAEAELARNPESGEGWELMAPVFMRLGRYADAARAYANASRLLGATADREAMQGVALVSAAEGVVTAAARAAFERALALDPGHLQSRVAIARALEQDGDRLGAAAELKRVLADAPPGAPWAAGMRREIARLEAAPGRGPSAQDMAAAEEMTPEQRAGMVRGMVEGLAARLAADGGKVEEWERLVRSWQVLGETEKAKAAAAEARERLSADAEGRARIDALAKSLGLGG